MLVTHEDIVINQGTDVAIELHKYMTVVLYTT